MDEGMGGGGMGRWMKGWVDGGMEPKCIFLAIWVIPANEEWICVYLCRVCNKFERYICYIVIPNITAFHT